LIDRWFRRFPKAIGEFRGELTRLRAGPLGETPLLLTIAAAVYIQDGQLPEQRSGLYGRFVNIWLEEAQQHGLKGELDERAARLARQVLEELAWAMTEQPASQTVTRLQAVAAAYLSEALRRSDDEARAEAKDIIDVLGRRSGLFIRRGEIGEWVHPT